MSVELRWVVPNHTTTDRPRLQYRNWGEWPAKPDEWRDVPVVVVPGGVALPDGALRSEDYRQGWMDGANEAAHLLTNDDRDADASDGERQ